MEYKNVNFTVLLRAKLKCMSQLERLYSTAIKMMCYRDKYLLLAGIYYDNTSFFDPAALTPYQFPGRSKLLRMKQEVRMVFQTVH